MSNYVGTTAFIAVIGWVTFFGSIQASPVICPYCGSLWELQSINSGPTFEQLNQASGRNHTDLVLVTGDTSASHSLAQPIFVRDTLISTEGSSNPGLYLGNYPQRLVLGTDVILTLQGLIVYNVAAKFSIPDSSSSSGVIGTASWSLSLDSFSLSPGSLLRLVQSRVVLQDCQVAQQLYDAASGQHRPQPPGFNITQGPAPDVYISQWNTSQLEMESVLLTCSEVCGSESGGVRTLRVTTAAALRDALRVVNDHVDGCSAYELELAANLSLAEAWSNEGGAAAGGGSLRRLFALATAAFSRGRPSLGHTQGVGDAGGWVGTLPGRGRELAVVDAGLGGAVRVTVNLTLRGVAEVVVLDAALLRSVFLVQPPARISLERITLINLASPQTGVLAMPMYFVASANITTATGRAAPPGQVGEGVYHTAAPRISMRSATLVLAPDELSYESTWLQSYAEGLTSSRGLSSDQAAWLRDVILECELQFLSLDSVFVSRLRFLDVDATDLRITSKVPAGFTLSQPTIGISHFAPSPLDSYPQILGVNSTAALVSALNASAGDLTSQPGLFQTYPGVPNLAAVSLYSYNRTAASVFAPVSYGRVVLQRSYVVGPYVSVISGAAAASGLLQSPVLDFGHTRSTWAVWGGIGFSLTLRNLTLVGLGSPSRWPSDRLVRCLDLPVWVLEGSRAPSLSGDPSPLILAGATVSVSPQELDVWTACNQILTGTIQQQQEVMVLLEACRSLGVVAFKARRTVGSRAMQIELLQGMGMQLRNCVIRDDVAPYQRYDLEELLLGWELVSNGSGGSSSSTSSTSSTGSKKKWILPVAVVGVVTLIATALLLIIYLRRQFAGDHPGPFVNVHMLKMMANNTLRPYAAVKMDSMMRWDNCSGGGGGGGGGGDSGLRFVVAPGMPSFGSGRFAPRFGAASQARSARFGEASSGHGTARISVEEGGGSDAGLPKPMDLTGPGPLGTTGPRASTEQPRGTLPIADGRRNGGGGGVGVGVDVDGIDRGGDGGGGGGFMRAFAVESVPECVALEPAAAAAIYDGHGGPMVAPWGTGYAWPAASNFVYQGYVNAHAAPYQGNMQYGYLTGLTTGTVAPLAVAASETYDNSRGMSATSHTHIAGPVDASLVNANAEACVLPQDAAAAIRQAAAAQLLHAPGAAVPVSRTAATGADGTRAGGGDVNAVSAPSPPPPPPLDVQGSEIQPLTRSPQYRPSHSRPRQRWCAVDTPADSFLDAVSGPTAAEGSSPAMTRNHPLVSSSDTTVIGDSRSTSGGSGGGAAVAGPKSMSPRLLSRPGSNVLPSTPVAATATVSGAYGGAISPQVTVSLLTRSTSVDRAGSHSLVAATAFRDATVSTAEAVGAAVSERGETEMDEGGGKVAAGGDVTAQRPETGNAKSEYGMKALSQHQHNRLSRSSSAAGALMSVFRADRRMWPWSPDPDPGPHDHNQQHTNSTELTSVSPSILSSSRSLGSRRRSRRVVPPLGQAASVGGTSAAADAAAAARAVTFPRATASVSTSASTSAARDRRGSNWQELVIAAVTPVAAGPGCSSTESPPSPLVGLPHTGPSLSSPALLTAATSHPRALSGGGGSSGTITAQASRLQISNPSIDAGGVDAAAKAAAGVAAAAADTRGSGGISAPIPTAANSPGARMVRKSPFMIKPSASRLSESTGTAAAENASNLTPSRTEVSPSGGRSGGGGGGGSGGGAVPQLAGAAGGSLASAGASVILQQAFSEPVRPPRVSMVMAATPLPPADSLAGGGGGGGGGGGSGGATVTQPSHGAKPGLGRLLVGSLSNLFRVDSLTGGLQRAASPPPAALTPSGSSLTGMVDRLQTNRTSAVQLADVRQGESPTPSGAGAQRTSNTGSAAGTTVAGIAARGGGSRGVIATPAAMDLGTTLSELTADFESRLNENQLVIQQMLGSGAFGTVYKALWKGLQVAVKTLTLTTDAVTQGRHAALMEAALSKSIFHPNVVTTYTCDLKPMHVDSHRGGAMTGLQILNETEVIQEWRLYIVQEFCDGGSLRHAIEARSFLNSATGTPQMEWVLQMAREIAGGLQYLHEHNIIHGDLNPANVLLRRDDSSVLGYAAKIADFGLSVHMQGEQSHVSNTKRGTPFYTAPEVTHAGNLTRFADVFSYGVVLWELYCSRSCWMYGPQGRLIHQRGFPHLPPSCPRAYATLVSNCMQPAHKQRPSFKQIGVLLSSMLREYEYAARSAAAVVASPSSWYPSQAPSPPQERHLQGLFSAQPYILQSSQYERYSKERSSSPKLPSPQLNQALEPPQLLGRQQPVGQPLQPFQKASNRSSLESSTGGARSSTPTSTCSSPPPPSQQQQLPPAQVGFRSGLAVNVAAAAPIREGVNRRASWEPGTEAGAAAADGTNGPDGGGFVSPRCAAMGGTSDTRSDPDDLSVEPASATAMVSALGPSSSLPLTLLTLPTGVPPEVPSPTALLLGAPSSRTGTPAELPPAVNTVGASAPSESAEGVLAQSPQPVIYRQPAASAAAAAAASVSMTPVASMPPAPLRTGSKSMHTTVAAAAFKGFDGAARQQKPGLPGGGAEQSADLGVAAVTALPPPPLHNVRMVAPAATVAALSTPSTEAALATDSAVVPAAIAGDAPVNSGGGGGGGIVVPSSALAGVMRAFDIPAELPRFAPPDLPTVLEAEDEPTSGSHSVRSVSSHIPMPLGDSASLPDGSPMPDDFPLIEGGPSIGDKISSGVENGGSGNMAARVDVPVARIHSAPLHRRASESCSAVRGSAAAAAAAAAAEKGAATIRPLRIRTAPGMVSLAAAGAETGQEEAATELGSEDFALPALPAADGVTKSPRKLSIVGETFECANVEDEHQLLARRSVALPMDAVSEFGPVASEGHADTDASRLRVNVADADADAIDIAGVDDATLVNATSVATAHGAADATVASVDGDGPCGDGGSSVSRSHLPISLEATDEVKAKPWRDAGFPEDAKYGAAVAERLATAESAAVVYGSTKNGSSSQTVAAVQHFARVSLGAPSHDALTRQTSAAAIPAAVIMAAAGAGASFSRGSTGSLRQRHQTHNGPVSYQQRQQVRLQQRPTFSRLSLASGTGGSGTSINDHSPFCRPSLNAGTESPAIGLMPQHTVGLGLPSASGVSLFARPSLGSLALVPAPAEAAGGGANFASASAGPRFSRPSLGTLPPYAPLAVTATAAAAEAPPPATKWVQAAVLPPGTSPFARPTLTASEQSFHADAISHALATPRGPHWAPAADTNPFVRPSLGTRAVASSRSSETQATAEVPLTQAMKGAASPFARPSLYLQSRGSQAPPPHPPQMAPPPLPLATVGAPPAAGNLFVRPSLGADAHWVPALPLPPGPLPPPSLPSGHPASPGVSPFTRPSLGTRFPGGGALTSPPLVNTASPLPGTNPFARQSWNSVLRSGALPTAVAPPTSVAPPTAVAGTAAAHFTVGPFPMHSLGIPAHGRVSNEAIYTHSEDWRAGAGALSAIASPAVPQSSPYGRLSLNTRGGAAALHVHGAGAPPLTPPPAGPPFSRLTSGSHLPAPSAPLLGPMQGVMPLLLGPSLPALPVGVQILPPSTSSQQKPYQRACHQHEDVPTRYGSAKDAPQTRTLDANAAGASGGVHADGGGSGGGGGNIAVTAGPGAQPGPEITPADSVSDLDVEDMTFGPVAEESVDQARGGLGSPVHGETVAPTGPLEQKHQQLQPPKQEDLHPQAHGRLLAGLQVQTQAVAWSGVPAGAGLQQLQGQMGGAAPDAVSFETTRPPPLPSSALLPQHQHQHHHRHQVWAPGITEAASPGGGFGFGSPVLASLGSEASASVASLGRGSMPNTASTALPSATVPATAATLAAAAAVAAVASVSSRQAPQGAIVDSGNGPAAAAMASPGWISLEGPDRLLPVPLPSYSHAKGVNSGDHLSRSLDSAALFGISEVAQNSAYAFGHGHRHGPQFNKGMVWRDAPLPCVAADGGLWIGGGTSAVCRRRAGTAGPSSHSSGQVGSLSRSYNAMYPSSMPRSAVQTAAPGSWLSPSPPLPLPLGVSSASTRPPPRFQRDSLRTLEAAAATAACGSTGAQTGVNTWDGDREQQQQQRQRQRQQPRQRKAQPRGGLLRALRSAVMPGSHSLRSEPAAAAAAAAATSDSDKERESSGAESGGGGGGGSYRQGGQQPPSFSRRGFSFGNGADDADGDDDGAYADREDVRYRSREGGDSGSRNGHVVMDLLAAGSLTAALAMPRPSRAGAASASQLAEVRIPPQDLPYISSSVPSALAPGMLAGSPGISASVAVASATSTGASRTFVPRFNRLGTVVNGGGGGGAGSSAFNLDVSEHASGTTSTAGIISASGTSFDDAFRLAKSSLSTVPESGPSLSQASITRSSQGSERLMVATGGSGAGGDQTATITPFGRISHRSIGREDAGSGGASGSAMRTHNIAQRNHGSSGSRPRSPEEDHRPPSAEEPMHIVTGARAGARLWPLPEAAPLSSSAPTAVVASVMQRIGVRGAKQSS